MNNGFPKTIIGKIFAVVGVGIMICGIAYCQWQIIHYDRAPTEPFDILILFGSFGLMGLVIFIGYLIEKRVIKK